VAGRWGDAGVVRGFSTAAANEILLAFARAELARRPGLRVLDVGCGAARNAAPMAAHGVTVVGTDMAWPMLEAARHRVMSEGVAERVAFVRAPMDRLPLRDASIDLVVAHGIWNLARSAAEFRRAIAEAARIARPGAGLFLFTFSRATLAPDDQPVPGEPFVFTQFAGEPQCFLTEAELLEELLRCGFEKDPAVPLTEYNRSPAGRAFARGGPVIYEGTFRAVRQTLNGPPLRAARAPSARLGVGDLLQRGLVVHDEAVGRRRDEVFLAPSAHDADGRLDGRPCQLRDLLAREREGDLDASGLRAAHARGEREEEARDAPLDRRREIREPACDLELPDHEALQEAARHLGVRVDRREEGALGDAQNGRGLQRDRGRRETLALEDRDGADGLARAEEAEDDVALRSRLDDFHTAEDDEAEVLGGRALPEDLVSLLVGDCPAEGREDAALLRFEALEERDRAEVGEGRRHCLKNSLPGGKDKSWITHGSAGSAAPQMTPVIRRSRFLS